MSFFIYSGRVWTVINGNEFLSFIGDKSIPYGKDEAVCVYVSETQQW